MIVNFERDPKFSLYFIGAKVIEILKKEPNISLDSIYQQLNLAYNEELSINYFYLAIDWLYLIDKVAIVNDKVNLL